MSALLCREPEDDKLAKDFVEFICRMQGCDSKNSCFQTVVQGFGERPDSSYVERLNAGTFKLESFKPEDESVASKCIEFFEGIQKKMMESLLF